MDHDEDGGEQGHDTEGKHVHENVYVHVVGGGGWSARSGQLAPYEWEHWLDKGFHWEKG